VKFLAAVVFPFLLISRRYKYRQLYPVITHLEPVFFWDRTITGKTPYLRVRRIVLYIVILFDICVDLSLCYSDYNYSVRRYRVT